MLLNHIKGLQFNIGHLSDLILITQITPDLIQTLEAIKSSIYGTPDVNYEIDANLNQT